MFSCLARCAPPVVAKHKTQGWWTFKRYEKAVVRKYPQYRKELKYINRCRVAIVGLGGVGKSLAHLLKMYPGGLTEIRLCNRSDPDGMVVELNHIPTRIPLLGFSGPENLREGLRDVDIVLLSAGESRKQDTTREELFRDNAMICFEIMNVCADVCPEAWISILTNPVDSLVPVAAAILKQRGVYRPERLFGICDLDQMRAQRYYADAIGAEPLKTYVPVVGGHSETTTVPLFSKGRPNITLTTQEMQTLVKTVRNAGRSVVQAKKGLGGSTYSMASATMYFVHKLSRAMHHEPHLVLSAYVESSVTSSKFFSNELIIGPDGVHKNLGYGKVTDFEQKLIDDAVKALQKSIEMGEKFVRELKFT